MKAATSARPLTLERVRRRLERWRRTRPRLRSPIPESIWADAVTVARQWGLYQTARALPIHYGGLKRHLEAADRAAGPGARAEFVELRAMHPNADGPCVIELDGVRTTVRIRLQGMDLPDLVWFSRAIAGVDA
jgi:hypothetical protein